MFTVNSWIINHFLTEKIICLQRWNVFGYLQLFSLCWSQMLILWSIIIVVSYPEVILPYIKKWVPNIFLRLAWRTHSKKKKKILYIFGNGKILVLHKILRCCITPSFNNFLKIDFINTVYLMTGFGKLWL